MFLNVFDLRLSPPQRPLCIVGRAGEREKEIARGTMGRGNKPSSSLPQKSGAILNALYSRGSRLFPLPIVPRALSIFSIIAIFIGIPSGSLGGGERISVKCPVQVACEHALHLRESREVTRDPHARARRFIPCLASLAVIGELALWLSSSVEVYM